MAKLIMPVFSDRIFSGRPLQNSKSLHTSPTTLHSNFFNPLSAGVTDGRTDRQTDIQT